MLSQRKVVTAACGLIETESIRPSISSVALAAAVGAQVIEEEPMPSSDPCCLYTGADLPFTSPCT